MLLGSVTDRADRVVIAASGPSFPLGTDLLGTVIAVNGMGARVRADYTVTIDSGQLFNRLGGYSGRPVAAVPVDYGTPAAERPNWQRPPRIPADYLFLLRVRGPLSQCASVLAHNDNSGSAAINFAYHLRPARLVLLGMDHNAPYSYCYGNPVRCERPWLGTTEWYRDAARKLAGIGCEVVNGSPESAIDSWPRTTPEEAIEWLSAS